MHVPACLGRLTAVRHLKLNDTLTNMVPASIRRKGEKEIVTYFRTLFAEDHVPYKAAKVRHLKIPFLNTFKFHFNFFFFNLRLWFLEKKALEKLTCRED